MIKQISKTDLLLGLLLVFVTTALFAFLINLVLPLFKLSENMSTIGLSILIALFAAVVYTVTFIGFVSIIRTGNKDTY